jgi:hypothetical protein
MLLATFQNHLMTQSSGQTMEAPGPSENGVMFNHDAFKFTNLSSLSTTTTLLISGSFSRHYPLEPMVHPTTQASSFRLSHSSYYV